MYKAKQKNEEFYETQNHQKNSLLYAKLVKGKKKYIYSK